MLSSQFSLEWRCSQSNLVTRYPQKPSIDIWVAPSGLNDHYTKAYGWNLWSLIVLSLCNLFVLALSLFMSTGVLKISYLPWNLTSVTQADKRDRTQTKFYITQKFITSNNSYSARKASKIHFNPWKYTSKRTPSLLDFNSYNLIFPIDLLLQRVLRILSLWSLAMLICFA